MAWDDDKSTGDNITADEWDNHVSDQKGHSTRHESDGSDEINVEDLPTTGSEDEVPTATASNTLTMTTPPGEFDSVEIFNSDGSFNATDIDLVFAEVVGGGGGGGGVLVETGDTGFGGGGGGGGYAAGYVDVSNDSSISVTVGSGGSGGDTGGNDGSNGENSQFGTTIEAAGGEGGGAGNATGTPADGGTGVSGDITIKGNDGFGGSGFVNSLTDVVYKHGGGDTVKGSGAPTDFNPPTAVDGNDGVADNGGGGQGGVGYDGSNAAGGDGADGIVIVYYDQP